MIFRHFDCLYCDMYVCISMHVCLYVCLSFSASLQPKRIKQFIIVDRTPQMIWQIIAKWTFIRVWKFKLDDIMVAIWKFIFQEHYKGCKLRFSSNFETSSKVAVWCLILKISKIGSCSPPTWLTDLLKNYTKG